MEELVVRFRLIGDEAKALGKLADLEFRHPRDQVRFLLLKELSQRGFLSSAMTGQCNNDGKEATDD